VKYKVFFHQGDELLLKTRVLRGNAWIDAAGLHVEGSENFAIPGSQLATVELFRLYGLGRVIRVEHSQGRLFLSVIRLMIGQFAFINFFKTGALYRELAGMASLNLPKEKAGN
jgi:hypothetical protein